MPNNATAATTKSAAPAIDTASRTVPRAGPFFAGQHLAFVVEDLEYDGGGAVDLFRGEG
ncbi:MAG: hypothetical protein ACM3KD_04475 [Hyphomicrobiaceae bacterium]